MGRPMRSRPRTMRWSRSLAATNTWSGPTYTAAAAGNWDAAAGSRARSASGAWEGGVASMVMVPGCGRACVGRRGLCTKFAHPRADRKSRRESAEVRKCESARVNGSTKYEVRTPARCPREGCRPEGARPGGAVSAGARLRYAQFYRALRSRSPTPAQPGARPTPAVPIRPIRSSEKAADPGSCGSASAGCRRGARPRSPPEPRVHLLDAVQVDDGGAVDARGTVRAAAFSPGR